MTAHSDTILTAKHISKSYRLGKRPVSAVHDVSMTLHRGEFVAIVGPSGSGKTTLAHILGGLITPDSGDMEVEGVAFSRHSDRELSAYRNKMIGFVFQNFNLLPHYNVLENVCMPLMLDGVSVNERERKAKDHLSRLGIIDKMLAPVDELSGGEQQRVAIARAFVCEPRIVIADEPTGSLDSRRAKEVVSILKEMVRREGVTVVMVTHDLSFAAQADRVIHILDGRISGDNPT